MQRLLAGWLSGKQLHFQLGWPEIDVPCGKLSFLPNGLTMMVFFFFPLSGRSRGRPVDLSTVINYLEKKYIYYKITYLACSNNFTASLYTPKSGLAQPRARWFSADMAQDRFLLPDVFFFFFFLGGRIWWFRWVTNCTTCVRRLLEYIYFTVPHVWEVRRCIYITVPHVLEHERYIYVIIVFKP